MDYQKQATDFMKETGATMTAKYLDHGFYWHEDKEERDIYCVTLRRNKKSYSFKFGQSINGVGKPPRAYDVLACLTKYDPGTFDNFCGDYGDEFDSRKAEKTYKAVVKEFKGVKRVFGDVIDKLAEIQ